MEKHRATLKTHAVILKWKPATVDEMKAFFALVMTMDLVHQQDMRYYWSTDPVISTPFFSTIMPRNRFLLLLSFLHYNDNTNYIPRGQDGYDPLYKLGTVYHDLTHLFTTNYYPTKNIAIGEGLVPWKGNTHHPDNPDKFGIKSYQLCDQTGYCCKYELYTGKRGCVSEQGATYDLCMRLMDTYLNRGHHLYVDDFYTSPLLFAHLYEQGTGACGTLRTNRKHVPPLIKEGKPDKGQLLVANNGPLMVMTYHDKSQVSLCSTLHKSVMTDSGKVTMGTEEPIMKPDAIVDYNKYMGAVDRSDHTLQYHAMRRKTLKWYKKVMFHLFDLCSVQAYLIYKMQTNKPVLHRTFKRELVKQIVTPLDLPKVKPKGRPHVDATTLRRLEPDFNVHYHAQIEKQRGKKSYPKNCVVCNAGERRYLEQQGNPIPHRPGRQTSVKCGGCNVPLCVMPCFKIYHTCVDIVHGYLKYKEDQ